MNELESKEESPAKPSMFGTGSTLNGVHSYIRTVVHSYMHTFVHSYTLRVRATWRGAMAYIRTAAAVACARVFPLHLVAKSVA